MDLSPLFLTVQHLRATTYTCAAGITVLLYDMMLTMPAEVALIWPARFSLVKVLYFLNRYLPVPCILIGVFHLSHFRPKHLSDEFCKLTVLTQLIGQAICLISATWLLVLRVTALYANSPFVKIGLYIVWFVTQIIALSMATMVVVKIFPDIVYNNTVEICSSNPPGVILGTLYFSPVACEVALIVLQMYHHYRHFSTINPIQVFNRSRTRSLPPRVSISNVGKSRTDLQFPSSLLQPPTPQARTSFAQASLELDLHKSTSSHINPHATATNGSHNLLPLSSPTGDAFPRIAGSPISVGSPTSPVTPTSAHVASQSLTRPNLTEVSPEMKRATPLLRTLYVDGLIYFVVVVALRLWSFFIFTFGDTSLWYLSTYLEFSLVSTSVSRLVLHLRGAATEKDSFVNPETEDWDDIDTGFSIDADPAIFRRRGDNTYDTSNYDTSNYASTMERPARAARSRHGRGRYSGSKSGVLQQTRSIGRSLASMSRTSFRGMGSMTGTGTWMSLDDVDIPSGALSPEVDVPPDVLRRAGVASPFSMISRDGDRSDDFHDHFYSHSHTRSNSLNQAIASTQNQNQSQSRSHVHTPSHDSAKERFGDRMRSPSRLYPLPESPTDPHSSFHARFNAAPRAASTSQTATATSTTYVDPPQPMESIETMASIPPLASRDSIGSRGSTSPILAAQMGSDAVEMRYIRSHHSLHGVTEVDTGGGVSHRRGASSKSSGDTTGQRSVHTTRGTAVSPSWDTRHGDRQDDDRAMDNLRGNGRLDDRIDDRNTTLHGIG